MARSTLVRVSQRSADRVKRIASAEDRTLIAQMDRVIEAGIAALHLEEAADADKPSDHLVA